jgi:hypothetical protein
MCDMPADQASSRTERGLKGLAIVVRRLPSCSR